MSKILIVEDEEALSDPLAFLLGREGFQTIVVDNGLDALPVFDREGADLVLLDVMLPGMSGMEVCRKLREVSSVPIIMLTAKDSELDKVLGLELGADDYVTKPYSARELIARIRAVLRRRSAETDSATESVLQGGPVVEGETRPAEKAKKAFVGRELKGKRVGVVGLGNVGSKVANALVDLGMDVYGYDPFISVEHAWALSQNVQRVGTLEDLCRGCDYLTLHVPSKADTKGMISTEQLALLAPGAVLINYARETIIDEDAVHAALESGKLSWFAGDFATPKTVLMPNTYITTHSGAGTGEAEANCADMAISELKDYLENGNIANSVNYPACNMGKARAASRIACLHANVPNMIGQITAILAKDNANVQRMVNESAGENAYTMFDTDEHLDSSTIEALKQIPAIYRVRVIK